MKNHLDYRFLDELKNLPFIDEIWLYGSRAREDNRERSDIDLAIVCKNSTDEDWAKVTNIIEEADTLLKIDCIKLDKNKISKDLYSNILKDRKPLYVKNYS